MDSLEQGAHKSCETDLVPIDELVNLHQVGFKLIPLRKDSRTPNVASTNAIYNDTNYWTEEKLQDKRFLFYNVATTFGRSHIKDGDGKDLYLNELDIDSEQVFTRLARISSKGKDYNFLDELCQSTFVVKTKKRIGRRLYWYSHNQNKPIRTRDCQTGCEFEIKSDNSNGHSTLPPSCHRDDPSFHYQNIGQNKIAIRDKLYDGILDLLSDCMRKKPAEHHLSTNLIDDNLGNGNSVDYSKVASIIVPAYHNASRNDIIFGLSGFLFEEFNLGLKDAERIVTELCQATNDEELSARLVVLRNTYKKANSGRRITGRKELVQTLERIVGIDSANWIISEISEILNHRQHNSILSQLDDEVRAELSDHIFEVVSYDPVSLVVAHAVKKQILTCRINNRPNNFGSANYKVENLKYGDVVINAAPSRIICYENPLNNNVIKYQISFESPSGQNFAIGPKTPMEIISELRMRSSIYKPRIAEEALNAILNGAQRDQRVSIVRKIETPGYYFIDKKIVASEDITPQAPSSEDVKKCAQFINELVAKSKHPEILITELKWGILAPFSYVFKQLDEETNGSERWMPWLYLDGYTKTSKTTDSKITLAIYRKHKAKNTHYVGFASANNIARLGQAISRDTFPVLIDEAKLKADEHGDLIEAIKHAVQNQTARTKLSIASDQIHIPALSSCILTSNYPLPVDPALRRRFLNLYYPKDDKPTDDEIKEFESFLKSNLYMLGSLGDFATNHLLNNQEIITDGTTEWAKIAKTVLEEFFTAANMSLPDWIDLLAEGSQIEDVAAEEEQIVRSFFTKKINDTFSRNYKSIEPWKEQEVDSVNNKYGQLEMRLNFCLDNQLISFMRRKNTTNEVVVTIDILKELRDAGINFIQHFTDLARMLKADTKTTKVDGKASRPIITSVAKLMDFISDVDQSD
jgi:hypothetical protein